MSTKTEFSIKDVRRIETEIDDEISFVERNVRDIRSEHQQSKKDAEDFGLKEVQTLQDKMFKLIEVRFKIREIVANFNTEHGINDRTAKIAKLEQQKDFLEDRIASFGRVGTTRDYNLDKVVYTPGVTSEFVDQKRAEVRDLTRQIQRLKDSCNGINSNTKVTLEPSLISFFKNAGMID